MTTSILAQNLYVQSQKGFIEFMPAVRCNLSQDYKMPSLKHG